MAYVGIVLTNHKQSDLYQNHTQLLQLLCQVPLYYPHQGSFSEKEQQDLLFAYFLSILQLILVLTYAILMVLDRTAWDRHLDASLLGCLWNGGIKKFLCHDWLMFYSPLS